MNPAIHPEAQSQTPGLLSRLAWLPIPLLIAAILVLKALDWQTGHESEILMMLCNFVFSTLASLLVVVLFGRSFLARGMPGMLWFGCGVLLWGAAGTVSPALLAYGINVMISVHNILVCLSAFCQLAGAILLLKPPTAFREVGPPLVVAHVAALGAVALVTVMVLGNRLPVFFVQGTGGTTLRYVVLASASVMFALAAALLWMVNRRAPTVFVRWYGPALLLVATGLFGIMIESVHGGALSWTGRIAQFLGGAYMLVAALASVRESGAWKVTLSEALEHAREAVRVSEERYRMLFDAMTEGFALHEIITDGAGRPCDYRFLDVNPAFERLTELKREDLIGKRVLDVMPDTEFAWIDNYGKVALTGEPLHLENYSKALKRWYEVYAYRTGQDRFAVVFSDITERKKAEDALADAKNNMEQERDILQAVMDGAKNLHLVYLDRDFNFVRVNETYAQTCGFRPEQMIGKNHFALYPHAENEAIFRQARDNGETVAFHDKPFEFPDQPERGVTYWDWTLTPVKDTRGQVSGLVFSLFETTERKQAEDRLKQLNEELEDRVAERTEELATTIDNLQIEIVEREKAEEDLLRLNRLYAVLSETNQAIVRTRDRDSLFNDFCRIAVEDGCFKLAWVGLVDEESGELKMVAANGATSYLDDIKITVKEEPEGLGPTGISVREGTYYICNDFLGSPVTRPWHDRGKAHDIRASASIALKQEERVIGALTLYADKKDFFDQAQVELLRQMGVEISFALDNLVRETLRLDAEQKVRVETLERLRVVEALREKEQMLLQQSRQAAMGEMISNIAHQWRQPLNALGLTVQQLPLFYDLGELTREFLENNVTSSMELIQHMSKTIDDFRNYFRPDKEKVKFYLSESIADTLSLVNESFKKQNIDIEIIAKNDAVIYGYRNEFAQVLLNILNNAMDALIERKIKNPRVSITIRGESNRAILTVNDNAGGIPEEILSKIFDPYFTTKGPQAGTGVGLYMSKSIIEKNMGGKLTARNIADGAEFRIEV